jgi:hypothetical protein
MAAFDPKLDAERYLRQILLPEIGAEGQTLVSRAVATVRGGDLAGDVAVRYARTAGFGGVADGPLDLDALAPSSVCSFDAPRAVLAGARATLAELRVALGRDRYAPRTDVPTPRGGNGA